MNVVHLRISQISIPLLEKNNEDTSYFLSVHIGPTFIEFPLQLEEKKFLKSQAIISFNYDSADNYKFYLELLEKKPYSEQTEIASIEIPIRICVKNRQSNGSLEMDIKNESFLDNLAAQKNDEEEDEYDNMSDNEYDSDEEKSIKIFFEIHRSENKTKRFGAPLEVLRDLKSSLLTTSRQSFDSSCSFSSSFTRKRRSAKKLAVSPKEEDGQENDAEIENEKKQQEKEKEKEEQEEEFQQVSEEKEPENEEGEDQLTEDDNGQESSQLQQNVKQEEETSPKDAQEIEEEEEEDDDINKENKNEEEEEKVENNDIEDKNDRKSKSKAQSNEEELLNDDENDRPKRQIFLSESDSQNSDDNEVEGNENNDDQATNDDAKHNIINDDDDDNSIPPVELKTDLDSQEDEKKEEFQNPMLNLSSDSVQFAVYPPRKKSADSMLNKESQSSDTETNQQTEQENQQLSDNHEESELKEQQKEPELNEQTEEPEIVEQQEEPQKEDQVQQQQEIMLPPFSVDQDQQQQQQPIFYPQLSSFNDEDEPPVQQQPPILKFSSLDMQNFQCIDNFSFYPSPEQIGSYYIPPSLLPISIHPPRYD